MKQQRRRIRHRSPRCLLTLSRRIRHRHQQGTRQTVQWDDLELDAEYSPALISVENLSLTRGKTDIQASGQLHAGARTAREADLQQQLHVGNVIAHITDASVTDLMSIAGESVPVTGTMNLQVHAGGALNH